MSAAPGRPEQANAPAGGSEVHEVTIVGADRNDHPKVSPQFRLQYEDAQKSWVLLYPEGMVKLNQSAGEILRRCDGTRTVAEIVTDLESAFGAQALEKEVLSFLEIARAQGWVDPIEGS